MKLNQHTALSTSTLLLVPYEQHHVPTYHTWMQDAALQHATASEPLELDEEYCMQASWRTDRDKLTFIICLPLSLPLPEKVEAGRFDIPDRMVGDVNLFLFEPDPNDDDDDDDADGGEKDPAGLIGEIELMVARKEMQGKGLGRSALVSFMYYVLSCWARIAEEYEPGKALPLAYLRAKINVENERSINLFRSLGFEQFGSANYFGEVELRWRRDLEFLGTVKGFERPATIDYGQVA